MSVGLLLQLQPGMRNSMPDIQSFSWQGLQQAMSEGTPQQHGAHKIKCGAQWCQEMKPTGN